MERISRKEIQISHVSRKVGRLPCGRSLRELRVTSKGSRVPSSPLPDLAFLVHVDSLRRALGAWSFFQPGFRGICSLQFAPVLTCVGESRREKNSNWDFWTSRIRESKVWQKFWLQPACAARKVHMAAGLLCAGRRSEERRACSAHRLVAVQPGC